MQASTSPLPRSVHEDTERLAMSTLSFQEYVRERMMSKRMAAPQREPEWPQRESAQDFGAAMLPPAPARERAPQVQAQPAAPIAHEPQPIQVRSDAPHGHAASPTRASASASASASAAAGGLVEQMQAMQQRIEQRLDAMMWLHQVRQQPVHSAQLLRLVQCGFSPDFARSLIERIDAHVSEGDATIRAMALLAQGLQTDQGKGSLTEEGGIYALVGPTGVGKTTSAVKLAARCIKQHGVGSVGLITMDTQRPGAHEQLRASARALGVVAHLAHDPAALQEMLGLMHNRKLVLIDTAGHAPGDERLRDMLGMLELPGVRQLLALPASAHRETIEACVRAYRTPHLAGALLCKADEAARLAPALQVCTESSLRLRGVCNGQRVPEDLVRANAVELVRIALRASAGEARALGTDDLVLHFSQNQEAPVEASNPWGANT
ncbi:MAG: flagellar biosynthesis protein FlhF [Betaproteobacteria bacterium]|nr:flagellar biosynthesis protein FlhF [Betaproteobacteria bacterium]